MSDRFVAGSKVAMEIETEDSTLPSHTARTIWYIPPTEDGMPGVLADKASVPGTAVEGNSGLSVNRGDSVVLIPGLYAYWSTSTDPAGEPRTSPAFEIIVEREGTVRR